MNFEEYLKKPFDEQEFEYKEAYWQSAEKLIDRHYKRAFWLRAGIISLLLITAAGTALYLDILPVFAAPEELPARKQEQVLALQEESTSQGSLPGTEEKLPHSNTSDSGLSTSSHTGQAAVTDQTQTDKQSAKNDVTEIEKKSSIPTASTANAAISPGSATAAKTSKAKQLTHQTGLSPESEMKQTDANPEKETSLAESSSYQESVVRLTPEQPNSKASAPPLQAEAEYSAPNHPLMGTISLPFAQANSLQEKGALRFFTNPDFNQATRVLPNIRSSRIYAAAELLMYPSGNSEAFKFLGFNGGIGYQQPIGSFAFVDAGVSASIRRGNFAPSIVSTQLNYDFGPRNDAYILRPNALFSLQVPVLFGIERGRHQLSAGVKMGFLIGVRGTSEYANYTHPFESGNGEASYAYNVVDEGWIESKGLKKFALAYAFKYQYQLTSRIMLGASVQYLPSDWIANDFGKYFDFNSNEYKNPATNPDPAQLIERNWLLGVELKYVLFSKQ